MAVGSRFIITSEAGRTNYLALAEGAVGVAGGYLISDAIGALLGQFAKINQTVANLVSDLMVGAATYYLVPSPTWSLSLSLGAFSKFIVDVVAWLLKAPFGEKVKSYAASIAAAATASARRYSVTNTVIPRPQPQTYEVAPTTERQGAQVIPAL